MAAQQQSGSYTVEEYFALGDSNPNVKYAYLDGHIYMMSGGTKPHSRIAFNISAALDARLGDSDCQFYNSDMRVQLSLTRYVYPDVTVTCDPSERDVLTIIKSPRVVFEVLSPSTEKIDRNQKMSYYRACPTIMEYVLILPTRMYVEVYRRDAKFWQFFSYAAGEIIELASLDLTIPIEEFYRRIELAPEDDVPISPLIP
jgi:Uma2 family endonuclease